MFQRGKKESPAVRGFPQGQVWGCCLKATMLGVPPSLWPWQCPGVVCHQWGSLAMIFSSLHHKGHNRDSPHPLTIQLESPRCSPRQGLLCLGGISHLFISFPREGELSCLALTMRTMQPIFIALPSHLQGLARH